MSDETTVGIYGRYSSAELQRPASIDDQNRQVEEAVGRLGWIVVERHADEDIPGTVTERRPGYQALLAGARAGRFRVIAVDELSRLSRVSELLALYERLQFWGVGLFSLLDGLNSVTSPEAARAIITMKTYTIATEGVTNAHRSRRGLAGRVLAGMHAGGRIYGYATRPVHADAPGDVPGTGKIVGYEYLIVEAEAEIIRRIFLLYSRGMSPRAIAALLNVEGVTPPAARWKGRIGARCSWSHNAIWNMLRQPKYNGELIWNRSTWPRDPERDGHQVRRELPEDQWVVTRAEHLRIVPLELWQQVRDRAERRSEGRIGRVAHNPRPRLLSGLLLCARCGARMTLRGQRVYGCASRHNRGETVCDCRATVNAAEAEASLVENIGGLFQADRIQRGFAKAARALAARELADSTDHHARHAGLRRQLADSEQEVARLVEAIRRGVMVEDLVEAMRTAGGQRDRLRQEVAALEASLSEAHAPTFLPTAAAALVDEFRECVVEGHVEQARGLLGVLVERIEVHERPPLPRRKRPSAELHVFGRLEAVFQQSRNRHSVNSPGGIRTRDLMAENHAS